MALIDMVLVLTTSKCMSSSEDEMFMQFVDVEEYKLFKLSIIIILSNTAGQLILMQ